MPSQCTELPGTRHFHRWSPPHQTYTPQGNQIVERNGTYARSSDEQNIPYMSYNRYTPVWSSRHIQIFQLVVYSCDAILCKLRHYASNSQHQLNSFEQRERNAIRLRKEEYKCRNVRVLCRSSMKSKIKPHKNAKPNEELRKLIRTVTYFKYRVTQRQIVTGAFWVICCSGCVFS